MQVAVYGSLRKGLGNHDLLKDSKFIGQFETDHIYNLLDLGNFPGLTKGGSTSVIMEVYKINAHTLTRLDNLEGYVAKTPEHSFYIREKISSPLGQVSTYFLNRKYNEDRIKMKNVDSGDWTDYYKTTKHSNITM
jgi:gamma-glutamylcyclotransferase (GGCT)/AIG2-like uncharacterized protein YtfP